MYKRILSIVCLLSLTGICLSQSNLVLYDADGYRIGTILGYSHNYTSFSVYTSDGHLMSNHPRGAQIGNFASLYYASADCTGQAYVSHDGGTANDIHNRWTNRGGEIFAVSDGSDFAGIHARLDWAPTRFASDDIFTNGECWRWDACGQPATDCREISSYGLFYPATIIDNAQYGIKDLGDGQHGYRPPLIPRVEKSNVIYCDSFESCPTQ